MHGNGDWYMGWMGGMGLWWLLIIAAVGLILWFAARRGRGGQESPEQGLKRRYSSGDIDRETYERMLEDLRK